jgi:hypothetical protein
MTTFLGQWSLKSQCALFVQQYVVSYLFLADPRAVRALCQATHIQHVVYVSCKADSPNTVSNFVQLCDEGKFSLDQVVPVDLFPHTLHTELVLAFSR